MIGPERQRPPAWRKSEGFFRPDGTRPGGHATTQGVANNAPDEIGMLTAHGGDPVDQRDAVDVRVRVHLQDVRLVLRRQSKINPAIVAQAKQLAKNGDAERAELFLQMADADASLALALTRAANAQNDADKAEAAVVALSEGKTR